MVNLLLILKQSVAHIFFKPMEVNKILGSASTGYYFISWETKIPEI